MISVYHIYDVPTCFTLYTADHHSAFCVLRSAFCVLQNTPAGPNMDPKKQIFWDSMHML